MNPTNSVQQLNGRAASKQRFREVKVKQSAPDYKGYYTGQHQSITLKAL